MPGGSLDLEKGSGQLSSGATSTYDAGGSIDFDDDLDDDGGAGLAPLELDVPNAPAAPARGPGPAAGPPPPPPSGGRQPQQAGGPAASSSGSYAAQPGAPSSGQAMPPAPSSGHGVQHAAPAPGADGQHAPQQQQAPRAKPSAAEVIAKYPAAPTKILEAPMYAIRVVIRQLELRTDLESLRRRRSPDVPLYEAALKAYEPKTFRLGMAINGAALALATVIFFLPVIFRFMGD